MGFIRSQLLNVIEWSDNSQDTMVYQFPVNGKEIKNGASLTVRESQVAIFVSEGKIADVFYPGRYKLVTANLPVLTKILSWKYDFNSPFKCEVYFVNTKQFQGLKWGTSNPFALRDAEFGLVRIRAFGTYSLRVIDAAKFLKEVFGSASKYTVDGVSEFVKSNLVATFTDFLADQKMPVIDIPTKYIEIGDGTSEKLNTKLDSLGLKTESVVVENISFPEEIEKAIDERSSMGVIGNMNQYTQFKAAKSIEDAAKNPNGAAGTGVGIGAAFGFGGMLNNAVNGNNQAKVVCPNCGQTVNDGKFCPECGKPLQVKNTKCIKCGANIKEGSKFCPECGASQKENIKICPNCGKENKGNVKFCAECGTKLN